MNTIASERTDEELAKLVQAGDGELFGLIMSRYEKKLLRYGRNFLSDPENIEDIVHDVFLKTYQNLKSFDPSQKFSSWIYRIAHNAFVNGLKKSIRNPLRFFDFDTLVSHPIYEDGVEEEREQAEIKKMIDSCLAKLAPKYREIVTLFYYEEQGYKEIADILQIPPGTVGIRLRRAKEILRKEYAKQETSHGK